MRFLICGLGSIGRRHLQNLRALGQEHIGLLRSGKSTLPNDDLAGLPAEGEIERALARFKPNAVIVSNPTALHLDVAIPAAKAGCHLLIEKPVSHNMNRIDELKEAVSRSRARVLVGFQFRFHPGLREVKRLLGEGAIGKPLSARAHWGEYLPDWHPWEDYRQSYAARAELGGGVVLTLCHPLDYLRWLLGEATVTSAWTAKVSDLELDVEDTAEISLQFQKDVRATVRLDYCRRRATHWLELIGAEGRLRWDSADGGVRLHRAVTQKWEVCAAPPGFERNSMFMEEMRHFVSVVRGEAEPTCTLDDGIETLRLISAVYAFPVEKVMLSARAAIRSGGTKQG